MASDIGMFTKNVQSNPSVLLEIHDEEHELLEEMQRRLHHVYWNGCMLSAHVMLFSG